MRDSLLSRFRGAFLGALLGEVMGTDALSHQHPRLVWQQMQGQFGRGLSSAARTRSGIERMLSQTSALIGSEGNSTSNSGQRFSTESVVLEHQENRPDSPFNSPVDAGELVLTTLPLALFYHDQPSHYRTALQVMSQQSAGNESMEPIADSTWAAITVIGHAVSLMLRERFIRLELIPQILKDLDLQESCPDLAHQLVEVQAWIEQASDLANIARYAKQRAVSSTASEQATLATILALYSFLSTPDDFRLSLLRSAQLHSSILLPTLTGAISGLYNGVSSLPVGWRQQVWSGEIAELSQRWGIAGEAEVEQFADRLLACWSGAADPLIWLQQPQFNRITAAPRAIRPD